MTKQKASFRLDIQTPEEKTTYYYSLYELKGALDTLHFYSDKEAEVKLFALARDSNSEIVIAEQKNWEVSSCKKN